MALRWMGGDAWLAGVPARDLSDEDIAELGLDATELTASGLYADAGKVTKPAPPAAVEASTPADSGPAAPAAGENGAEVTSAS